MADATIDPQLFIKMVISNWELQTTRFNSLLLQLSDQQLEATVAPGRNTGAYILGHMVAVNEGMKTILGYGARKYESLDKDFITTPFNADVNYPSVATLRAYWDEVCKDLEKAFFDTTSAQWFEKHESISAENFAKEPHRNKLNIVINRTNHMSYHLGQLIFLKNELAD